MELEVLMVNKISPTQKDNYLMISLIYRIQKTDFRKALNRMVVTRGWGVEWGGKKGTV
jgi:hypothetical protein